MNEKELRELFTNGAKFGEFKKTLLSLKENNELVKYLDLIVPIFGNNKIFSKSVFIANSKEIHESIIKPVYDFELIHKKTISYLNEAFSLLKDKRKEDTALTSCLVQKTKPLFSAEPGKMTFKIIHGGGLRNIINFLLHKNNGYELEGDSRTGLQVHHSRTGLQVDHDSCSQYSKLEALSYGYANSRCEFTLDIPAALEAEIDGHWLLHANNDHEAAILPSSVLHLKKIKIIPVGLLDQEQSIARGVILSEQAYKERYGKSAIAYPKYIEMKLKRNKFKNTFDAQRFGRGENGVFEFYDYSAFVAWAKNVGYKTEEVEVVDLRHQLGTDSAKRQVVTSPSSLYAFDSRKRPREEIELNLPILRKIINLVEHTGQCSYQGALDRVLNDEHGLNKDEKQLIKAKIASLVSSGVSYKKALDEVLMNNDVPTESSSSRPRPTC